MSLCSLEQFPMNNFVNTSQYSENCMTREFEYLTRDYVTREFLEK